MRNVFYAMLAVMALAGFSIRSNAAPLTVYHDRSLWEAAVAGLALSSSSGPGTQLVTRTTISYGVPIPSCHPPFGTSICINDVQTTASPFLGLSSVVGYDLNDYPYSSCFECTEITRVDFALDVPVLGFAADNYSSDFGNLTLNGFQLRRFDTSPEFFGLVGPISVLSFSGGPCCGDTPSNLDMRNFVFATAVPEPFTVSLFGIGFAGTIAMRRRKAKAAALEANDQLARRCQ
jgi:hypothetical protein